MVTLEEHSVLGGLGGAVAEWLSEQARLPARLLHIGTPDRFFHETGDQSYARQTSGSGRGIGDAENFRCPIIGRIGRIRPIRPIER